MISVLPNSSAVIHRHLYLALTDSGVQAIKASSCYVDDISKANVVFVYDYCYYIWWLAHIHSALGGKVAVTPGDHLIKVRLYHQLWLPYFQSYCLARRPPLATRWMTRLRMCRAGRQCFSCPDGSTTMGGTLSSTTHTLALPRVTLHPHFWACSATNFAVPPTLWWRLPNATSAGYALHCAGQWSSASSVYDLTFLQGSYPPTGQI
jgi:hypothetical protein